MEKFDPKIVYKIADEIFEKIYSEIDVFNEKIGQILVRKTQDVLRDNQKVATGDALKSVAYEVEKISSGFTADHSGMVRENVREYLIKCFLGVNYSQFIYDDTKPHFPPVEKISSWVRTKGLSGRYSIKTRRRLGAPLKQQAEDRALAWAIAKKISRKGTKGIKFFDIALKQAWPHIQKEFEKIK